MGLRLDVKRAVLEKLEEYEGRVPHLYLDSIGRVTVGVGHLVSNKAALATLKMYQNTAGSAAKPASLAEKHEEYDRVVRLKKGYRAAWYRAHTRLIMQDVDIDALTEKHTRSFYRELIVLYGKSNGYKEDFDHFPKEVQIALFDMIFNLGATKLAGLFVTFNQCLRAGDWVKAADACHRLGVAPARNEYVRQLFLAASREAAH